MNLKNLIDTIQSPQWLIDASGVLYSDQGFLPKSSKTFQYLQSKGPTFLASNNSYHYVNDIVINLKNEGDITLDPNAIISSGHGLAKDPEINKIISNKIVYFIGPKSAKHYALDAPIKGLTQQLDNAEVIILSGLHQSEAPEIIKTIINFSKKNPAIPIICCNKDHYIRAHNGLQPVVGYFASIIEKEINKALHWFGKPLKNYSMLVKDHLAQSNLKPTQNTIFFDDNIENIVSMQKHIGISGCWVIKTGIFSKENKTELIKTYGKPVYSINSFSLDEEVEKY